ncbi:MAG TPA: sugar phosphate nucleotidyltransferase [Steroidobacteraceae bacterium]|nr:sugar phosphate nucleotidyltransferase [Steroidobacteraceae bacterium]
MDAHDRLAREALALVLAGGNGTRLGALTQHQCKPALSFGGHFRNIDFTLSNCVNSGVRRIAVLTQYKAQTLIEHLAHAWSFLARPLGEAIDVWPAQQRLHPEWYAGTADAIWQNLDLVMAHGRRTTLILAGDHVYCMDYRKLLAQHRASGAPLTVACVPVPTQDAGGFGVLELGAGARVRAFTEKPAPEALAGRGPTVLASMGVYAFETDYLAESLARDARRAGSSRDFGRDLLPLAVAEGAADAFAFQSDAGEPGYWRDVGTLESYWRAHMDLVRADPPINLHDPDWPIHTHCEALPPARIVGAHEDCAVADSILSGGAVVRRARITRCVLGTHVQVDEDAVLEDCVVLGGARIGAGARLSHCVVQSAAGIAPCTEEWHRGAVRLLGSHEPQSALRSVA